MPAAIPVVASAGLGAIQANQVKQKEKGRYAAFNRIFDSLNPEIRGLYEKALSGIDTGYTGAANQLSMAGTTAKNNAALASARGVSAQTDSAIGRGLYGTSAIQGIQRGAASDLSRTNAGIDEQTASMLSQLMTQRAGATAGLLGQQAGAIGNLGMAQASGLMGQQFAPGASPSAADIGALMGSKGTGGHTTPGGNSGTFTPAW